MSRTTRNQPMTGEILACINMSKILYYGFLLLINGATLAWMLTKNGTFLEISILFNLIIAVLNLIVIQPPVIGIIRANVDKLSEEQVQDLQKNSPRYTFYPVLVLDISAALFALFNSVVVVAGAYSFFVLVSIVFRYQYSKADFGV